MACAALFSRGRALRPHYNDQARMSPQTLRAVPLFESLDDDAADTICSLLIMEACEAGADLFRAGDAGDAMYLIEDGKIQISMRATDGEDLILAVLGPGDFFGEMALID